MMEYKKTKEGYLRHAKDEAGKLRFEHCIIWEKQFGKIPLGMQIHHIDFDKTNNSIENLLLVTPTEHKRYHSDCIFENGIWYKKCKNCGEYKEANKEHWYYSRGWINGKLCKKCYIKKSQAVRDLLISKGWKRKTYKSKKRKT